MTNASNVKEMEIIDFVHCENGGICQMIGTRVIRCTYRTTEYTSIMKAGRKIKVEAGMCLPGGQKSVLQRDGELNPCVFEESQI